MMSKQFLVIAVLATAGIVFSNCHENKTAETSQQVFRDVISQVEPFGYSDSAFHLLDSVFLIHKEANFKNKFYYYDYASGYYHVYKQDDITALKYADSMLLLVRNAANPETEQAEIALANMGEGDILFALKKYSEAYDYYYHGKIAAEKSLDPYTLSEYSYRLGMVMYRKEKFNIAAHYFIKAFDESGHRKNGFSDFYRRQEILNNAALSYLNNGQTDSAVVYSNKGLAYIKENEYLQAGKTDLFAAAYGVLYGTMAQAYLRQHNAEGEKLLQNSIALNIQPHRESGDALLRQLDLAGFYLDSSFTIQVEKAYHVLNAAKQGIDTLQNEDAAIRWNSLMSRYYYIMNKHDQAYYYLAQYNTLHEIEIAENKTLNETDLSNHIKLIQDSYELNLLKANNQLKTTYLRIAVILCAFTAVILFLIYSSWKKKKKNIQKLTELNKQVEQQKLQLETTLQQLDKQNKEKDYILRVVAHDLRNPLSAISTLTRIVSEEYENEEDNKEFLELAQTACKDSLNMIDSILQLADHNKTDSLKKRVFNITETVIDCVELLRFKAGEKNQQILLHLADTPQYTLADAEKINRVINNLVINAIKFSHPDSVIDVYVEDRENKVEVIVKDEGIGIPDNLKAKVFDVFTEAKRKGTSQEGTFGLGLSICKQLVEAHGGEIWLESKENAGTSFHILLQKQTLTQSLPEYEGAIEKV